MARNRSRSREAGSSSRGPTRLLLLLLLAAVVVGAAVVPTASFSLAALDRGNSVDIVNDNRGIVGLSVVSNVDRNTPKAPLVTVTNRLAVDDARFTVKLLDHTGSTLYAGGSSGSPSVTFTLDQGVQEQVTVDVVGSTGLMAFKVSASGAGLTASLKRSVQVVGDRIELDILIRPQEDPNPINPESYGVVPVAVLNTSDFDPRNLAVNSLRFGSPTSVSLSTGATPAHNGHFEDVDADGDLDLVLHFPIRDTGYQSGDETGKLVGKTVDGRQVSGTDSVTIVGGNITVGSPSDPGTPGAQQGG